MADISPLDLARQLLKDHQKLVESLDSTLNTSSTEKRVDKVVANNHA